MAANTSPIFVLTPNNTNVTFVNGDGTSKKTIFTPGANGARVSSIVICSDDTTARNLAVYITVSGTDYYIGNVAIPAGSGYTTVARVEALSTLTMPNNEPFVLPTGTVLKANMVVAVTAAKTVTVSAIGGDF